MNYQKWILNISIGAFGLWLLLMVTSYYQHQTPSDETSPLATAIETAAPQGEIAKEQIESEKVLIQQLLFRKHLVVQGETLSLISRKYYGTSKKWRDIYEANRDHLKNYDTILPGTELVIP